MNTGLKTIRVKMKTYEEMIRFTVDQEEKGRLRYTAWAAYILFAEMFGKTENEVATDMAKERTYREEEQKRIRKENHRKSNEERRLANLTKHNEGSKSPGEILSMLRNRS